MRKKLMKLKDVLSVSPVFIFILILRKILYTFNLRNLRISHWTYRKIVQLLQPWFIHRYRPIIEPLQNMQEPSLQDSPNIIWMCWIQGIESIPDKYSSNINSIRKNNPDFSIRIVDLEIAKSLIDFPEEILKKFDQKIIPPVLIADFIRVSLLEKYGGIWMDMTIHQIKPTPPLIFSTPFWTVKGLDDYYSADKIPNGKGLQLYYLASHPHSLFFQATKKLFTVYLEQFEYQMDYFDTYYLANVALSLPNIRHSYSLIPSNNTKCESIHNVLEHTKIIITPENIGLFLDKDTWIYKCTNIPHVKDPYSKIFSYISDDLEDSTIE